jgi:putative DNA primase/helicase
MRDGAAIAAALGGRHNGKGWSFCCPCHDDRVPSASIRNDGLVTCFAGCPRSEVMAALDALGFTDNDGSKTTLRSEDYEKRIRQAQAKWNNAEDMAVIFREVDISQGNNGEFIERYLRHRGITLPVPAVLRQWNLGEIIACVQQLNGTVTAVQIKGIGRKGITHGWMGGGAVQLAPPCDGELGLAEGVESALSATQLHGVPCWATLGANRLDAIDLPSGIRRLHLFADNDEAGRAAVERAKRHYTNRLLPVRTWWPPDGQDWNDVLKGKP